MTNLDAIAIKNAVTFIQSAQKSAKKVLNTSVHVSYTRPLYTFPNILENIS